MSDQREIAPGDHVRFGTQALNEITRVYVQNLDDKFQGEFEIRPIGKSVTDIASKVFGRDYYRIERRQLGSQQFWEGQFRYAGAIMEVANVGHTRLKVWTDL